MENAPFDSYTSGETPFPDSGNAEALNEQMLTLARRMAALLANCSPEKRALILLQAQSIWDGQSGDQARKEESFMDVTSEWLTAVLNELSPAVRIEVLQLLSQMRENARFERLAAGAALDEKA